MFKLSTQQALGFRVFTSILFFLISSLAWSNSESIDRALALTEARYNYHYNLYLDLLDTHTSKSDKIAFIQSITGYSCSNLEKSDEYFLNYQHIIRDRLKTFRDILLLVAPQKLPKLSDGDLDRVRRLQRKITKTRIGMAKLEKKALEALEPELYLQHEAKSFESFDLRVNDEAQMQFQMVYVTIRLILEEKMQDRLSVGQKKRDWAKERESSYADEPILKEILRTLEASSPTWWKSFVDTWKIESVNDQLAISFGGITQSAIQLKGEMKRQFERIETLKTFGPKPDLASLEATIFKMSEFLYPAHNLLVDIGAISPLEPREVTREVTRAEPSQLLSPAIDLLAERSSVFGIIPLFNQMQRKILEIKNQIDLIEKSMKQKNRAAKRKGSKKSPKLPESPPILVEETRLPKTTETQSPLLPTIQVEAAPKEAEEDSTSLVTLDPPLELPIETEEAAAEEEIFNWAEVFAAYKKKATTPPKDSSENTFYTNHPLVAAFKSKRLKLLETIFDKQNNHLEIPHSRLVSLIKYLEGSAAPDGTSHYRIEIPKQWTGKEGIGFTFVPDPRLVPKVVVQGYQSALTMAGITPAVIEQLQKGLKPTEWNDFEPPQKEKKKGW